MRLRWATTLVIGIAVSGCDDTWKAEVMEHDLLFCRFQAQCAESTVGLDCEAYEAQYVARPDPCTNYDDYYMDACLDQLRILVTDVEDDPEECPSDISGGAPACGQAFTSTSYGLCNPPD